MPKIKKNNLIKHEKELIEKYKSKISETIIDISNINDWRDSDFLEPAVYEKIAESSVLIGMTHELEIRVSDKTNKEEFKTCLEKSVVKRVLDLKKQNTFLLTISGIMFTIGAIFLILSALEVFSGILLINEILLIFSWVFIWTSIEKFVFERKELKHKRLKLIYISNSKII